MSENHMTQEPKHGDLTKSRRLLHDLLFVVIPVLAFYLMEAFEHNPFVEVRPRAQVFNMLLFELAAIILYGLIGRMQVALRILLAAALVFGLVNHYVMLFRSTPFVPWDLLSVGTAGSVISNYDLTPGWRVTVIASVFLLLMILVQFLSKTPKLRLVFRLPAAGVGVAAMVLFSICLQGEQFQLDNYLYPFLFTPAYMTKVNGMAVTFTMNLKYLAVEKPKGYDREKAEKVLAEYEGAREADQTVAQQLPNVIVIMDEAFSDLAVLGKLDTNVDYMPFVHSLQKGAENTVTGYAQVSVCGGNTANSEFEFLTGDTMAFLPGGSIPYQQYIKSERTSLASYLASLGYETYAQHPFQASGWNRKEVYPRLGFAHMDFLGDYGSYDIVRKHVSDESDFLHVIETFEQKPEKKPAFIFNVTMQNHGGYTDQYANFQNAVTAGLDSEALDQYLSLVKLTDSALEKLVDYFRKVEEPTILVFFGDHQPSDAVANVVKRANRSDSNETQRYQVPYLVWANYEIPKASGVDTSLNYLAAQMCTYAGIPTNAYQNFLLDLSKTYPVLSAAGETMAGKEQQSAEQKKLTYEQLQYYHLFE